MIVALDCPRNLTALKILHHLKRKLKNGKIPATSGYVKNLLARSGSLHCAFIPHMYASFIFLLSYVKDLLSFQPPE